MIFKNLTIVGKSRDNHITAGDNHPRHMITGARRKNTQTHVKVTCRVDSGRLSRALACPPRSTTLYHASGS